MNSKNNLLLLSSGLDSPSVRPAMLDRITGCRSAVIVTTASREFKEKNKHAIATRNRFLTLGMERVGFLDVEFEDAAQLLSYEIVYIAGGHPFYLMHHLKRSGADTVLQEIHAEGNALIVGSSAGAVVLGPDLRIVKAFDPDLASGYDHRAGVALVPFTLLPHVNRWKERLTDFDERLKRFAEETNLPVTLLADGEALFVGSDGTVTEHRG